MTYFNNEKAWLKSELERIEKRIAELDEQRRAMSVEIILCTEQVKVIGDKISAIKFLESV